MLNYKLYKSDYELFNDKTNKISILITISLGIYD